MTCACLLPRTHCSTCPFVVDSAWITKHLENVRKQKEAEQVNNKAAEFLEVYGIEDKEEFTGEPI